MGRFYCVDPATAERGAASRPLQYRGGCRQNFGRVHALRSNGREPAGGGNSLGRRRTPADNSGGDERVNITAPQVAKIHSLDLRRTGTALAAHQAWKRPLHWGWTPRPGMPH